MITKFIFCLFSYLFLTNQTAVMLSWYICHFLGFNKKHFAAMPVLLLTKVTYCSSVAEWYTCLQIRCKLLWFHNCLSGNLLWLAKHINKKFSTMIFSSMDRKNVSWIISIYLSCKLLVLYWNVCFCVIRFLMRYFVYICRKDSYDRTMGAAYTNVKSCRTMTSI